MGVQLGAGAGLAEVVDAERHQWRAEGAAEESQGVRGGVVDGDDRCPGREQAAEDGGPEPAAGGADGATGAADDDSGCRRGERGSIIRSYWARDCALRRVS